MDNIINTFKYTFSLNQLSWIIFYFYKQNALITSDKKNRSIAKQKFLRNKNLKAKLKNIYNVFFGQSFVISIHSLSGPK